MLDFDHRFLALHLRAELYALIRQFFSERGVLEVETPVFSQAGNSDPNIQSFRTEFSGHASGGSRERWMRTSPEFALKRLLACGVGDCYELGRVFRDGEAGRRHNPEFTMLEWYRVGWDHRRLADETIEFVRSALALVGREAVIVKRSYRQLFLESLAIDPLHASLAELQAPLQEFAIAEEGLQRDDWLDLLLTHRIEPTFSENVITVILDYPPSQCALAKIRHDESPVAERFELYLGKLELANGYHELTDAKEQRARFDGDNQHRRERDLREIPIDERLLAALESGLPDCAGVALGVDRLLMAMLGTDSVGEVLAFAFDSA
ncbi:MAG: EF-P lysine aminoacylase EpmA [Dokdonella sp.]